METAEIGLERLIVIVIGFFSSPAHSFLREKSQRLTASEDFSYSPAETISHFRNQGISSNPCALKDWPQEREFFHHALL
jgi:hypothetical protein